MTKLENITLPKLKRQREQARDWRREKYANDEQFRDNVKEAKRVAYHEHGAGNTIAMAAKEKTPIGEVSCPCCRQSVRTPTLEIVVDHYELTPLEKRVLEAVWRGKGMPVMTERIFDKMYEDDPNGGPTPSKMYLAFKVALCHLRKKIQGSGVDVENVGYRRGYRLVLGGN
jgi:hypothetical protein